ncbi:uncharacterized protein BT62DRAFT_938215 [Guyanagaster necrorhizus]|uniref:DH domain-containing protein n=1 Tax=Guyanagaster necrorhizus TaxID=856835 RepID=A0A9P8ALX1_9AGAR|nr:uncharacterized protein BT62DRAFT_938215 [Guyanagaster necrorhizus MCA 3950]KAG7440255.1 hypothetical protein BT62DRAFT_938215 [Guyanagaster necrorhizus MCA 3950]
MVVAAMDVPELIYRGDMSTSSISSHSHELVTPSTSHPAPRPPRNKLRKPPPPGSPFSFVLDTPPSFSHFPYSFSSMSTRRLRSPTSSPVASTVSAPSTLTSRPETVTSYGNSSTTPLIRPKRAASMPSRKLTKQRPTEPPTTSAPPKRRATLSFNFRRRKVSQTPPPSSFSAVKLAQCTPTLFPRRGMFTLGSDNDDQEALPSSPRPPLVPKDASPSSCSGCFSEDDEEDELELKRRRRWTLMTDDAITDEAFAETVFSLTRCTSFEYESYANDDDATDTTCNASVPERRSSLMALFTTRDLLRTERRYLNHLYDLLRSSPHSYGEEEGVPWPSHPSPLLMHTRLIALIDVSQALLGAMESDPSVAGIAGAFVAMEDEMGHALSGWCAVVGGWFDEGVQFKRQRRPSKGPRGSEKDLPFLPNSTTENNKPKRSSTMLSLAPKDLWRSSTFSDLSVSMAPKRCSTLPSSASLLPSPGRSVSSRMKETWRKSLPSLPPWNKNVQTVRDRAILPVQRVTRYILFYRDLLKHTEGSSPSRGVVEEAVAVAGRIAKQCDDAQGNERLVVGPMTL